MRDDMATHERWYGYLVAYESIWQLSLSCPPRKYGSIKVIEDVRRPSDAACISAPGTEQGFNYQAHHEIISSSGHGEASQIQP